MIETTEIVGPAPYAPYFVNGDQDFLEKNDLEPIKSFEQYMETNYPEFVIVATKDNEDPWFSWNCKHYGLPFSGGNLITYIGVKHPKSQVA